MSRTGAIALRVFSGEHLGAEILLPEGAHVIGSDDSCDIILRDAGMAPRHAQLSIAVSPEEGPSVAVLPLDGEVTLGGASLEANAALPVQTPFFFGPVCLAWAVGADDRKSAWNAVRDSLQTQEKQTAQAPAPDEPAPVSPAADSGGAANIVAADASDLALPRPQTPRSGGQKLRWGVLCLAVLALSALTITFQTRPPSLEKQAAETRKVLDGTPFSHLSVTADDTAVRISGTLSDDQERGKLVRLAQRLQYPVYLDIHVTGDLAKAVRTSFNSRDLYPDVREAQSEKGEEALTVAGYIRDGLVEDWAINRAVEDVPALAGKGRPGNKEPVPLIRNIRYASDVDAVLAPALLKAGLEAARISYLPGKILLAGKFTVEQRQRLDAALADTQAKLGVPVVFEVRGDIPNDVQAQLPAQQNTGRDDGTAVRRGGSAPQAQAAQDMVRLDVVGVTLRPMPFVSLSSGEKVFIGGKLPGDFILESISVKELTLRKNGESILYPLRGSQ